MGYLGTSSVFFFVLYVLCGLNSDTGNLGPRLGLVPCRFLSLRKSQFI